MHVQRERARDTKTSGLYREEPFGAGQPSPWDGKFGIRGRVSQEGTEGCWENLEARSSLVCKICTRQLVQGSETKHPSLLLMINTRDVIIYDFFLLILGHRYGGRPIIWIVCHIWEEVVVSLLSRLWEHLGVGVCMPS